MRPRIGRCLRAALVSLAALQAAEFSTYVGDANEARIARVIADSAGNTYVAGSRVFNLNPGANPLQNRLASGAFAMKLDPAGQTVAFAYLSGKGSEGASDVALDAAGNIYIAGATSSPDLPLRNPYQSTPGPGFIARFSPDGNQLLYSTYFPAAIRGLAVDRAGNMYVTGSTTSPAFPTTPGLPAGGVIAGVPSVSGAFLTKIAAAGDRIVYSTILAGSEKNCGCCSSCFTSSRDTGGVAVAIDPAGNAYIAGNTNTLNLPTTPNAVSATGPGAFVAKVNAAGTALAYLTYIGSGNLVVSPNSYPANTATALAVDSGSYAYVVGTTFDPKFPVTQGVYQPTYNGPSDLTSLQSPPPADVFVLKLNQTGTGAVWATYLGGKAADAANAVSVDTTGNVWIAGTSASPEFPNVQGWAQGQDVIAALNPTGTALFYSGRYPDGTASQSIAADTADLVHIAGPAGLVSSTIPAFRPATRIFGIANSAYGAAGGRISPGELISIYGPHIGPLTPAAGGPGTLPTSLGGLQVFIGGIAAPLLYVSDSQINAAVPFGLSGKTAADVHITAGLTVGPDFHAGVVPTAPQVFQGAGGAAAALNQDGSVNSADNPAAPGSVVTVWATGAGWFPEIPDGQIAVAAHDLHCCQAYYGGTPLKMFYAGAAPAIVDGVFQVNFQLPADVHELLDVNVAAGNQLSNDVSIFVSP